MTKIALKWSVLWALQKDDAPIEVPKEYLSFFRTVVGEFQDSLPIDFHKLLDNEPKALSLVGLFNLASQDPANLAPKAPGGARELRERKRALIKALKNLQPWIEAWRNQMGAHYQAVRDDRLKPEHRDVVLKAVRAASDSYRWLVEAHDGDRFDTLAAVMEREVRLHTLRVMAAVNQLPTPPGTPEFDWDGYGHAMQRWWALSGRYKMPTPGSDTTQPDSA